MRLPKCFKKKFLIIFALKKLKKNTLKSCSEKLKSTFVPHYPELFKRPKWPKQKNSCSKMWLLDQLHIELGLTRFPFPREFLQNLSIIN